jgi:hypothetical protein
MRIGRAILIPAIVAFGIAGPAVATTVMAVATPQAAVHVPATTANPNMYYHV